ncbi:hypothetical protein DES39_0355 [Orbus hercynius]|uniref:Uncharacterized protein n=1 Tax=Orbus hercynius TaxID=593135 RepID=A0A495RIK5_9GAMM|nr:hypothetical protein [Orbus hercynius]RKS87140.1 hypothetical protein DES39_0355 [Orbus hercynius]
MVSIYGYQLISPIGGIANSHLSPELLSLTHTWFPYNQAKASMALFDRINHGMGDALSRHIKGFNTLSYKDLFYNQVHIQPNTIDLGNIVSSQEFDTYVWNAHFKPKQLNAIDGVSDGVRLGDKTAPYCFGPLEEQHYKITITPEGPTIIDDNIIWCFDIENPLLHLTGNRVVAFSFMPNWDSPIVEQLEWSTDVMTSETGVEQRSALYAAPRRYLTANFYVDSCNRQLLHNMSSWFGHNWAVPIWPYVQFTQQAIAIGTQKIYCDTVNVDFQVGGLAFLWMNPITYEIAEIMAINHDNIQVKRPILNDWPIGTRIYPAISARFSNSPRFNRKTDDFQDVSIEFRAAAVSEYRAQAPDAIYKGYPVFDLLPDESEDLTGEYLQLLSVLDNKMALPRVTDIAKNRFYLQGYRWLGLGREERSHLKSLLYYLNGQQRPIWLPTHAQDLTVVKMITASEPVLTIQNCGYSRFASKDSDKKYLYIKLTDGSIFYRQIISSCSHGELESLSLDIPLNRQIKPEQILRISYMRLCRLNSDSVDIKHLTDSQGLASCELIFRRVLDNEL